MQPDENDSPQQSEEEKQMFQNTNTSNSAAKICSNSARIEDPLPQVNLQNNQISQNDSKSDEPGPDFDSDDMDFYYNDDQEMYGEENVLNLSNPSKDFYTNEENYFRLNQDGKSGRVTDLTGHLEKPHVPQTSEAITDSCLSEYLAYEKYTQWVFKNFCKSISSERKPSILEQEAAKIAQKLNELAKKVRLAQGIEDTNADAGLSTTAVPNSKSPSTGTKPDTLVHFESPSSVRLNSQVETIAANSGSSSDLKDNTTEDCQRATQEKSHPNYWPEEEFCEADKYLGDKGKKPLSGRYNYKKRIKRDSQSPENKEKHLPKNKEARMEEIVPKQESFDHPSENQDIKEQLVESDSYMDNSVDESPPVLNATLNSDMDRYKQLAEADKNRSVLGHKSYSKKCPSNFSWAMSRKWRKEMREIRNFRKTRSSENNRTENLTYSADLDVRDSEEQLFQLAVLESLQTNQNPSADESLFYYDEEEPRIQNNSNDLSSPGCSKSPASVSDPFLNPQPSTSKQSDVKNTTTKSKENVDDSISQTIREPANESFPVAEVNPSTFSPVSFSTDFLNSVDKMSKAKENQETVKTLAENSQPFSCTNGDEYYEYDRLSDIDSPLLNTTVHEVMLKNYFDSHWKF